MSQLFSSRRLAISGLSIALYVVVMASTQSFAFGQYQVRIATALYGLSAIFPFLILPFGIANAASNLILGGLGLLDIVGGGIVGLLTTALIVYGKRLGLGNWIIALSVTLVPGLGVPLWLSYILEIPYWLLASSLLVGQCICGVCSVLLVTALTRVGAGSFAAAEGGENR